MTRTIHDAFTYIVATLLLGMMHSTAAYEPDKTPENVQKKAVIITHDARLFKQASDNSSVGQAPFMEIYFMMKPARGNRIPVSKRAYKKGSPDGWLDRNSFVEWNTVQMIQLEPQSGRKLAKVFETQACAELFGRTGQDSGGCQPLGEEPNRSRTQANIRLLIPVFEKTRKSYQGGFIRVNQTGSSVKADPTRPSLSRKPKVMGYDIVFAVDSTGSMGKYFAPTMKVLQSFAKHIQGLVQSGEVKMPLRIGLLFYRDRLRRPEACTAEHYYLNKWENRLTENIQKVIQTLGKAKEATCSSEDHPEAVLDGLHRILQDTQWRDNYFRVIVLVGDDAPHSIDSPKNPMRLAAPQIIKEAGKKQIRFLSFKLGSNEQTFKDLALQAKERKNKGRYANIPKNNLQQFEADLLQVMIREWGLLRAANKAMVEGTQVLDDPNVRRQYDLTGLDALIIKARLPSDQASQVPKFVKGWIPQDIQNQLAVSEFIFMEKLHLSLLINTLESIAASAETASLEGAEAFIEQVKLALAIQAKVDSHHLFHSGESLNSILQKANILPFKTDILSFTAEEVGYWKPRNYKRINMILDEKVTLLREFLQAPVHVRKFGGKTYFYVPRAFFP
jgi:hypothetical protein